MANWSNPTNLSLYTAYTTELDARLDDLALGLDPAFVTATNVPTNSIRWSSVNSRWEKYNGTSWAALSSAYAISITGNAGTATALQNARTINGVSFNGTANITIAASTTNALTFNNGGAGVVSGTTFDGSTARTISFNTVGAPSTTGTNASGTWGISITGSAPTLTTARNINSVAFNGSADVVVEPYVEDDETSDAARFLVFVDNSTAGYKRLNEDSGLSYNPNSGTLTATGFAGALSGNATTATTLATARTINGVSFNGSANITITATSPNALTFSTAGDGAAGTTTYDGSSARSISYNSVGAPSATGAGASGTWSINISGNAATATSATSASSATTATSANAVAITADVSTMASMGVWFSASGSGAPRYSAGLIYTPGTSALAVGGALSTGGNVSVTGTITASGDITAFSDERLKTNWSDLPEGFIYRLADVKVGEFDRLDSGERQVGVGAQSLQSIMPRAVRTGDDGTLSVAYGNAALVACVMLARELREIRQKLGV